MLARDTHDALNPISDENLTKFLHNRIDSNASLSDPHLKMIFNCCMSSLPWDLQALDLEVSCNVVLSTQGGMEAHYKLDIKKIGEPDQQSTELYIRRDGHYVLQGRSIDCEVKDIVEECELRRQFYDQECANSLALDKIGNILAMPDVELITFEDMDEGFAESLRCILTEEWYSLDEEELRKFAFKLMEVIVSSKQNAYLTLACVGAERTAANNQLLDQEIQKYAEDGLEHCSLEELKRIILDFDGRAVLHDKANLKGWSQDSPSWAKALEKYELNDL